MSISGNPVSSLRIPLRWGDMDALGHANNTVYFRFFEEARMVWLDSLGLADENAASGAVIITTGATFLREMAHPATVEVKTYVGKAGNSSLDTQYTLTDVDTGVRYAEGYAKIVWMDWTSRSSTRLPDQLRELALPQD
ncbi:acyl-CoA thioesterase [Marinobacter xestospongiae]|uniref:Acyl-CoA thioesterase n=1 Tax=Marinobacter xestospongiae TaxID=994319 RepID=A0ABU3W093_9GAMM|nr:acyl-CoA thioesterase [Marinobacter xestospongiae]MDV2079775.1 acyl-CoA thioesterase [Marinobacter xestospongiae]